jgi:uracil-DNA glycosylase
MRITPTRTAAPAWTGLKFICERCGILNQLEAADACEFVTESFVRTPACPSRGCGNRQLLYVPLPAEEVRKLLLIGLEPGDGTDEEGESWNAT